MACIVHVWLIALLSVGLSSQTTPSPENLISWAKENSDVFVMLKYWNDLPLISTAWKRLRATSQVQEDRKKFTENLESFMDILVDKVLAKVQNASELTGSGKLGGIAQKSLGSPALQTNSSSSSLLVANLNVTSNAQSNNNSTSSETTQNVEDKVKTYETAEVTGNAQNSQIKNPANVCSCSDSHLNSKTFVAEFEEEKRWIRSQLTPLNYLFDKLKAIEEKLIVLQRDVSNTGRNSNVVHLNVTTNNDTATGSPQQHKVEIENLDTLSKALTAEYQNISAMVMAIEDSTKLASRSLEALLQYASNLTPPSPKIAEHNGTEDVEYCPEYLDEMVPCSEIGNSCYCFSKLQRNWTSAQDFCRRNDMLLLSFETKEEVQLVVSHIKNSGLPKDFYWTSGSDEGNEGTWIWKSTQQNITVDNWRSNQPDGGLKENCLYLHSRDEFRWGDWICSLPQYFVCEW